MKVRVQRRKPNRTFGYRLRPISFLGSALVHTTLIVLLGLVSTRQSDFKALVRDEVFRPEEHKIIYYSFRKPPDPPNVAPYWKVGLSREPRAREVAPKTVVATAANATSKRQMIWTPAPKIEIKVDLPLPNLVATLGASLPPPPDPPKPLLEASRAKPPKVFLPPVTPPKRPRLPVQPSIVEAPDPSLTAHSQPGSSVLPGASLTSLSVAPPPPRAQAAATEAGDAKIDIAVASLRPVPSGAVPEGARRGSFSQAPEEGRPATGDLDSSAKLKIPNLTIRDGTTPTATMEPRSPVLYTERVRSVPVSTLSVPLRPAARAIPRGVEFRFQGRSVYTVVVPIENFPVYSADWIIWFAERDQKTGSAPLVRAPIPYRKLEPARAAAAGVRTEQRVQFAAVIRQDGRLEGIQLISKTFPSLGAAMLNDLASWEFKPAFRDGFPIDVDIVIEIPFSLSEPVTNLATP